MRFDKIRRKAEEAWREFDRKDHCRVLVGTATCGRAAGAAALIESIRTYAMQTGTPITVYEVGCLGLCYAESLIELRAPGCPSVLYGWVTGESVGDLLRAYFKRKELKSDSAIAVMDGPTVDGIPAFKDHPMLAGQVRIVLRNCGLIDPDNVDHYVARDGYVGLAKALAMQPEEVIEVVKKSGLRGRGGAGFPTSAKWEFCRKSLGSPKYLICNADEGDPGAFMNRAVIESDPHSVLEGMAIAAYAIGASAGCVYVRAEYPLAIKRLNKAIAQAQEYGLLGDNILGTGFGFHLKLKEGAGAFVCGEETAMLASIEGRRGMPRPRPPFPAQQGLHGKPTNINNVETLANIPVILQRGGEWFASYGTEKSRGTKTFALAGKIVRTGLIEVPLGMMLQDIVFAIGGGIPDGKRIKAVQTGGPSGGCIPAKLLDIPVDYERLAEAGTIMGSGGMVVMDEDTCMVDIARYFVDFTQSESCGKCVPCRLGTRQMFMILNRITCGQGKPEDLDLLQEMVATIKQGSLCGLGQTAPNPVLTTLRYFRDEYEAHIRHKKCPAVVCRGLVEAPCKHMCPAGIDVPRYLRYIVAHKYAEALDVIREKIPFPSVCGWICFHPCETKCRRASMDSAIAVRALKRFAAEHGQRRRMKRTPRANATGKRVAVVGSGPGGLTAAYYLGKLGHQVTVLEKHALPGGMLRTGIPSFRLPREVLDQEIHEIQKAAGVRIRTNAPVASVDSLFKKGYDAVLLAYGAGQGLKMGVEGEAHSRVLDCVDFLGRVNCGEHLQVGGAVLVVGGGSSAMDTARTALRLGARTVTIIYRRTQVEMPAAPEEVDEAQEEGVKMEFLAAPVRIREKNGRLVVECQRMRLGSVDETGRRRPESVTGSEFEMEADLVIAAVGQRPAEVPSLGCEADKRGRVIVNEDTLAATRPGVFAAGDVVTGPASVVEAIAAGRLAACSIDRYLGGQGNIIEILAPREEIALDPLPEEEGVRPRAKIPKRPPSVRVTEGGEVEMTYSEELALLEANRCLRCDLEKEEEM